MKRLPLPLHHQSRKISSELVTIVLFCLHLLKSDSLFLFPIDRSKELPEYLIAVSKFSFQSNELVLCFYSNDFDWSLVSLTGYYEFAKKRLADTDFLEVTGKDDFVYNINPSKLGEMRAKTFKLDISKINRHVLMKQFSVNLSYIFLEDKDHQLYNSKYTFEVSTT